MGLFGSSKKTSSKKKYKMLEKEYEHHAHPHIYDWNWKEKNFNRISIVNYMININKNKNPAYLEIGCATNSLFDSVACLDKTGVDPLSGGTLRMTSDEFFSQNEKKYDAIFIDGLHEYKQVHKDALNAISFLNSGGFIAFHDFLPRSWKEQHVPRLQSQWCGDCWKLAFELHRSPDIEFIIADIDHGVGIAKPKASSAHLLDLSDELGEQQFSYYHDNFGELPIKSAAEAFQWMRNLTDNKR